MANRYVDDVKKVPFAKNPELEAKIRTSPEDVDNYLVYADWLVAAGDPRGELAIVQHELARAEGARVEELRARQAAILAENAGFLAGEKTAEASWRLGTFERLWLKNEVDWMDGAYDAASTARRVFDLPPAACLQELALGILRWESQAEDVPAVLAEAQASVFAGTLRRLTLGEIGDSDVDNAHHTLGDLGIVSEGFPRLERLRAWGSEIAFDAPIDLPLLRSFSIQTCGLPPETFARIAQAKLPKLEELDLWFGSANYGSQTTVEDLASILAGTRFPSLTRLGLCNFEHTDALVETIPDWKILPSIRRLDLSRGILTDAGAESLLRHASAWKHVAALDVSQTFLSPASVEALRKVGPEVFAEDLHDDDDPTYRYVAVAE